VLSPFPALAEPGSAAKAGTAHIAVESNADAMIAFVSFVMVRLSQKSARTGSKYRNIVEIVVVEKKWLRQSAHAPVRCLPRSI
jgi:hypothetical protein